MVVQRLGRPGRPFARCERVLKARSNIRRALLRCAGKTLLVFLLAKRGNARRITARRMCERPLSNVTGGPVVARSDITRRRLDRLETSITDPTLYNTPTTKYRPLYCQSGRPTERWMTVRRFVWLLCDLKGRLVYRTRGKVAAPQPCSS